MLGWTFFFIALTAEVKAASGAAEESTAPLHPSGRPTLHSEMGHKMGPAAQSGFTPLSVP